MDLQLTDDQRALKRGVRELLTARFGPDELRAAAGAGSPDLDRALWRELGEAGFFALRLPESDGGVGLGLPEAVLAFEEAGRVLLPGPLIATHLAAGAVDGAATGEAVVTAVDGVLVEWLDQADAVRGDATGAEPLRSVDPLTPVHRVPAAVPPGAGSAGSDPVAVSPGADPEAVLLTSLLTAAEQLGTAARTCELAVQHARTREQFGQPIGAFQAVKHLCAQLLVRVEVARAAVYAAAVTADPVDVAAARLLADEAAVRGARDCLQVHGGMGFTWESGVHLFLKRAWLRTQRAGGVTESEEMLADDLLAGAGCKASVQAWSGKGSRECRGSWHTGITER
ncbi:acyl-CoA dehydrogenase family protein [Streptomyces sp. NBC_00203]|uniref:acyl-CoA dehydrogenase family protein n=1 Tax=Streptomyces sp. NBC_00203 TaxID=2975680 RepID=UPI003244782E